MYDTINVYKNGEEEETKPAELETNLSLGKRGEEAAVRYLEHIGFEILERNWRCCWGEADIIALDEDGFLTFIEVKTRRTIAAGIPEESITAEKRGRYERIAMTYANDSELEEDTPIRFDAIGICVTGGNRAMLRHHRNYFDCGTYDAYL